MTRVVSIDTDFTAWLVEFMEENDLTFADVREIIEDGFEDDDEDLDFDVDG